MEHTKLFEKEVIENFNFDNEYIGYVLDNSDFETSLEVKVFIPELFGYPYENTISSNIKETPVTKDHIQSDLNIVGKVNKAEFVKARLLLERYFLSSKSDFIKYCKPEKDSKVLIRFINGNPNNCVFLNQIFISDEDHLNLSNMFLERDNIPEENETHDKYIKRRYGTTEIDSKILTIYNDDGSVSKSTSGSNKQNRGN